MPDSHVWWAVAVMALVTAALRFLPFAVFNGKRGVPRVIMKLGKTLPYAIMGMLVVYCLKGVSFFSFSGFVPHLAASLVVALIYVKWRNTLAGIICGTVFYMIMVQLVF